MVAFVSDTPEEPPQPSAAALPPSGTKQRCQLPCLLRDASLSEEKAKLDKPRRRGTFGERPEVRNSRKLARVGVDVAGMRGTAGHDVSCALGGGEGCDGRACRRKDED
jgi:hypothetical protein